MLRIAKSALVREPRPVIFIHITNTGGTSMSHALKSLYPADKTCIEGWGMDQWRDWFAAGEWRKFRFIAGHFVAKDAQCAGPEFVRISMVRDPITRIAASLRNNLANGRLSLSQITPERFVADEAWHRWAFEHALDPDFDFDRVLADPSESGIDAALERIGQTIDYVGATEHSEDAFTEILALLGVPEANCTLPRLNRPSLAHHFPLSYDFVRLANELTRRDRAVYNYALGRMIARAASTPCLQG